VNPPDIYLRVETGTGELLVPCTAHGIRTHHSAEGGRRREVRVRPKDGAGEAWVPSYRTLNAEQFRVLRPDLEHS
jgi:hypothetical protein